MQEIIYEVPEVKDKRFANIGKVFLSIDNPLFQIFLNAEVRDFSDIESGGHCLIPLETQYGKIYLRKVVLPEFICNDCGNDCDHYTVSNDIWREAMPAIKGYLCVSCLERRIGRSVETKYDRRVKTNREAMERQK